MVTVVLYTLAAIAVAAVVVVVLVVVLPDDAISQPPGDRVPTGLPYDRPVGGRDLAQVRLPVGLRGYRMVDTDAVLDRLVAELDERDRELVLLRAAADERRPAVIDPAADEVVAPSGWPDVPPVGAEGTHAPPEPLDAAWAPADPVAEAADENRGDDGPS